MIVHLIAGVPGKNNDGGIVKESTLPELLEKYSGQIMADGGYPCQASIVIPFSDDKFCNFATKLFDPDAQLQPLILTACAGIYNMKRIKKLKEIKEKEHKMLNYS